MKNPCDFFHKVLKRECMGIEPTDSLFQTAHQF